MGPAMRCELKKSHQECTYALCSDCLYLRSKPTFTELRADFVQLAHPCSFRACMLRLHSRTIEVQSALLPVQCGREEQLESAKPCPLNAGLESSEDG